MSTVALLSGGVGGARMARGLASVLGPHHPTIVVNVGDDEDIYGLHVSPDVDTVMYTLAGVEGPEGWGTAGDTFRVMESLAALEMDTTFRIGDRDLAVNLARTGALRAGEPLSTVTAHICRRHGVGQPLLPATDDRLRTMVEIAGGRRLTFQEYFVFRAHRDRVAALHFEGAVGARPGPGVLESIAGADLVVIAPSNPPLSIWPILAIPGIRDALAAARVVAVSPLFGGKALKGPADRVMAALGLPPGNGGVIAAYEGLLDLLIVDTADEPGMISAKDGPRVVAADTRIAEPRDAARFSEWLLTEAL